MYAQITKDHLWDGKYIEVDQTGMTIVCGSVREEPLLEVRLLDDDRELYYEALADDEALEALFEWAMHEAGVTILQVKKEGAWKDTLN